MLFCSVCVKWTARLLAIGLVGTAACGPYGLLGNATSLGGDTAGDRGSIHVVFINNTPYRAIFTYGVYDTDSTEFGPEFGQFVVDPSTSNPLEGRLEGNTTSSIITLDCARVFSIGGSELITRIKDKDLDVGADEEALVAGIGFSDKTLDDAQAGQATAGRADEVVTMQGTKFACDSLLVYTFTQDSTQASGFRVGFQVIPP